MLSELLSRLAKILHPEDARVTFFVVDNDAKQSSREVVAAQHSLFDSLRYICEPRRGIPVARNRAMDEALSINADVLCFIDDDECPDIDWLVHLVRCWRETDAGMVGGPVEISDAPKSAGAWQRFLNASLSARMLRKNRRSSIEFGRTGRCTILTNNWLCDLGWQRRAGVRFDEKLLVSGGSDTAFFRDARAAGVKAVWCSQAMVRETMTPDRLSLSYQFARGKAQSITNFRIKNDALSPLVVANAIGTAVVRFVLGLFLLAVPVYGIASPVVAVRSIGWSVGRVLVLTGRQSVLYR
jgi:GT2 family glycosyltransferase